MELKIKLLNVIYRCCLYVHDLVLMYLCPHYDLSLSIGYTSSVIFVTIYQVIFVIFYLQNIYM